MLRLGGLLFLPLAALAVAVIAFLHYDQQERSKTVTQVRQEKAVELGRGALARQFAQLATDVSYLAEAGTVRRWLASGDQDDLRDLGREFLSFASHKEEYDQVRFIDLAGNEIVRAIRSVGSARLTPQDSLQNKASRSYVRDALKLGSGKIYFSRFDLNLEHDQIELPVRPMQRVAAPVFDASGEKRGLIVLNYSGQLILTRIRALGIREGADTWLVNDEGYWLLGPTQEDEWAFMYPSRTERTFSKVFPSAWRRVATGGNGTFVDHGSLFAYATVTGSPVTGGPPKTGTGPQRRLHIISHVPLGSLPTIFSSWFILGCIALFGLLALLCLFVAIHRVRRAQARAEIDSLSRRLAHTEKMEALGQLTGGVAHDFNNLLAVIIGNAEILAEHVDDPELKAMAELVMNTAEEGSVLTERLLTIGRRQAMHPVALNVAEVIESLSATLHRALGSGIDLITRVDCDQPILADRALFESTIVNLAINAREAMPDGGSVTMTAKIVPVTRVLAADIAPGQYVRVEVRDTGVGMNSETSKQVFDPFFTTKEKGKGAGMGLATVYGFAKQSGGHAVCESRAGVGTSVQVYLPIAVGANAASPHKSCEPRDAGKVRGGTERVLVVEDEPHLRAQISRQLRRLGYHIEEAESGVEALRVLSSDRAFDILFTDVVMPGGVSGIELADRVREINPEIKVLLTTGFADAPGPTLASIEDPILRKPYKQQHLARALREVLDKAA